MQAIPATLIGIASALAYIGVSELAVQIQHVLWDRLPDAFGTTGDNRWWIFGMLTAVGILVGLVVWLVPGHAGPDPATTELISDPLPLRVLPGVTLALLIALAGGVSLGPENPIIAVNVGLAVWLLAKIFPGIPPQAGMLYAIAGTLGAMFGTPVAAALLLTEMKPMHERGELWDNMFGPIVAAGVAGVTTLMLTNDSLSPGIPPMGNPGVRDLVAGLVIAIVAALFGLVAVYMFEPMHKLMWRLGHPLVILSVGGVLLGILGAIGGEITLFKGLDQMGELVKTASDYTVWGLLLIVVVKIGALLVSATAGFRGGRIFPAVFVGLAIGEVAHALDSDIPLALAAGCGILGFVLATARDGWMSIFLAAALGGGVTLLPLLCLVILPVWLIVSARPKMVATPIAERTAQTAPPPTTTA